MRRLAALIVTGTCLVLCTTSLANRAEPDPQASAGNSGSSRAAHAEAEQPPGNDHQQARTVPEDQEASWLLQFEEILYSNTPTEESKAAATQGLYSLHDKLLSALPVLNPKRSKRHPTSQDVNPQRAVDVTDLVDTELVDTDALSDAADAAFMLGVLAATGIAHPHVPLNDSWAVKAWHAAAQAGSAEAHLALSHRYFTGDGVPANCQEGLRRARLVADEYVISTEGRVAPELPLDPVLLRLRHRHGSYDVAGDDSWIALQLEAELLNLADGHDQILGYRQLMGYDLEADPGAALQQFEAAAAQGDAYAAFQMGYMHMKGVGTPANATAAKQAFEAAAQRGVASAHNGLGVLHFEGAGNGQVDYAAARAAFTRGAEMGEPDAMFNLATLYAGGHGVPKNHTIAHELFLKAHDAGQWRAPHALALTHQRGLGVTPNCTAAKEYIQIFIKERSSWADDMDEAVLALDEGREWPAMLRYAVIAAQGSAVAQANLAWLLWRSDAYEGHQKAEMCLRLLSQAAAEMPDAWVDAGDIECSMHRPAQAAHLYSKAAQAGSVEGMYSLGWMHAVGQGVPHNTSHAAQLYKRAVMQAPDWQHAAPAFVALLLLPSLTALQWLQRLTSAFGSSESAGLQWVLQCLGITKRLSWDTWVLTAAAASLAWVLWHRHKRLLQMQRPSHSQTNRETGIG